MREGACTSNRRMLRLAAVSCSQTTILARFHRNPVSSNLILTDDAMTTSFDRIRIATPCPTSWEQMTGEERVRFCSLCNLNVYNFSSLTKREAEALIATTEGRLCARLYRRRDGTLITKDCPLGLRALRRKVSQKAAAMFALIGSLSTMVLGQSVKKDTSCVPQTRISQRDITSSAEETILTGQVFDPARALVPDAEVTLKNVATKEIRKSVTGEEGTFKFVGMPPGKYLLKIQTPGFASYELEDLNVKQKQVTHLDVILFSRDESVLVGVLDSTLNDPPGTTTITEKLLRSLPH